MLFFLFLIGLGNTLWQIFEIKGGRDGEYALAKEEREIGLYLGNQQVSNKVYTSNFYNYETIYYYSRARNSGGEMLHLLPLRTIDAEPFFLIIPSEVFRMYELDAGLKRRAKMVFVGDILTMFEMR